MSQGLFAAISGIRANQTKMNVISNNVANINTVAFKSSNVNFSTVFSQMISGGSAPTTTSGGTNPLQIGNGAQVSDIQRNFSSGGSLFTGRSEDFLIQGEGFFTIERPDAPVGVTTTANFSLTRAGNFSRDANGYLVTASGSRVFGTATVSGDNPASVAPVNIPSKLIIYKERTPSENVVNTWIDKGDSTTAAPTPGAGNTMTKDMATLLSYAVGVDGAITGVYSNGDRITVRTNPGSTNTRELFHAAAEGTSYAGNTTGTTGSLTIMNSALTPQQLQIRLAVVTNPNGLIEKGNGNYVVGPNAGTLNLGIANNEGRGTLQSGALESSNVDLAGEFTNLIVTQRGIESASKVVSAQSEVLRTIINIL